MLERLRDLPGKVLGLDQYLHDFRNHFWRIDVSWKLEREPNFKEPNQPSWIEATKGNWDRAKQLIEDLRPGRMKHQAELDEHGIVQRRVRFVTKPVTPYLRWELHGLRIWAELGEEITILPVERVLHREIKGMLPEVLVLGDDTFPDPVMYEILYDDGVLAGGRKFTDPGLIAACRAEIRALWREGEAIKDYFAREIADLPLRGGQEAERQLARIK